MTIALQFLGAARHVTGTKHLLEIGDRKVLLDCGLVQGPRRIGDEQNRKLPIAGRDVDALVLSHAYIDHCGCLPRLVRDGYGGPIWCTDATGDMLRMMLTDAAFIQAQDARHLQKRGHDVEPLYDMQDVERTLISTEQLDKRIDELAQEITSDYKDKPLVLVGILSKP